MVARLGDVLYWLGCIIAGLFGILILISLIWGTGTTEPFGVILFGVAAVIIWTIGRACRYVMAGR